MTEIDTEREIYKQQHPTATTCVCPECGSRKAYTRDIIDYNDRNFYAAYEITCHACEYYIWQPYTQPTQPATSKAEEA